MMETLISNKVLKNTNSSTMKAKMKNLPPTQSTKLDKAKTSTSWKTWKMFPTQTPTSKSSNTGTMTMVLSQVLKKCNLMIKDYPKC